MTAPTLDEFLRARLDETEARARESARYSEQTDVDLILATVAAHRRIITMAANVGWCGYAVRDFILGNLATIYDGHPDYRQEWKP